MAEINIQARWTILALAIPLFALEGMRRSRPKKNQIIVCAVLALAWLVPFLPGIGSAYPPTRFLLILGAAAIFARAPRWEVPTFNAACASGFVLWMILLGSRSYEVYKRLGYGYDLAHVLNIVNNTLHGRFLFSDYTGASILSHHLYLTLAFLAPVHRFVQSNFLPQAVQIGVLGLSTLVLAWGITKKYGPAAGTASFFSLLLHPAFQGQALHEFDPAVLGTLAASIAIAGYCADRKDIVWAGAICAMMSKEHFVLGAVIAGIVLVKSGCDRSLGLYLVGVAVVIFIAFISYTVFFGGPLNLTTQLSIRYGESGIHPLGLILEALRPSKLGYLLHMLAPSGGIALLAWPALLPALPETIINMTSRFPMHHLSTHYSSLSLPFFTLAVGHGIGKLMAVRLSAGRWAARYVLSSAVLAAIFSNIGPISHTGVFYDFFTSERSSLYRRLDALVSRMPPGTVGVRGNHRLLIYFADRRPVIELGYIDTTQLFNSRDLLVYDEYEGPVPEGYALIDSEGATKVYGRRE